MEIKKGTQNARAAGKPRGAGAMTDAHAGELLIGCVRAALNGGEKRVIRAEALAALYRLSKAHGLHVLAFDAVLWDSAPTALSDAWANDVRQNFLHDLLQRQAHQSIQAALREAGIRFLPLKGVALKDLYPSPFHRAMADLDYFLPDWNQAAVSGAIAKLGFTFSGDEPCHLHFTNPNGLHVEMHRTFVPSGHPFKSLFDYLERAARGDGAALAWSREDETLYLVLHLAKHFVSAGVGVRQVVDLYLFQEMYAPDEGYIREMLTRFGLYPFYTHVQALIGRWFRSSGVPDEKTDEMARIVLSSGSYGTKAVLIRRMFRDMIGARNSRAFYLLKRMFPSSEHMRLLYPPLKRHGVLLPVFWVWRLLSLNIIHWDALRLEMRMLFIEDTRKWKAADWFFR